MTIPALLSVLIAIGATGNGVSTEQSQETRDHLTGWYQLRDKTLVPVLKIDGTYYTTITKGFEIPLVECPEGLESASNGIKIGFDNESEEVYLSYRDGADPSGNKYPLKRIAEPSWLPDATAEAPRALDDFVGWYAFAWQPSIRAQVQKEGGKYLLEGKKFRSELTPLTDELGFIVIGMTKKEKHETARLVYNPSRSRFETQVSSEVGEFPVFRMPLARIPTPSPELDAASIPPMFIGIPSRD